MKVVRSCLFTFVNNMESLLATLVCTVILLVRFLVTLPGLFSKFILWFLPVSCSFAVGIMHQGLHL